VVLVSPIRQRLVALAGGFAGVSVSTARQRYLDLVAPGDPRAEYFAHPRTSGCALVVRGLWREAGLDHERLRRPYVVGQAIADVVRIAREAGAWVSTFAERDVRPGDVILVGAPSHEHVYTVVGTEDGIDSIDGGQLDDAGQQAIRRLHRRWRIEGGRLVDVVAGRQARPVVGLVDVDRLPWPAASRGAGCDLPGA
jgi:hypothetical protein